MVSAAAKSSLADREAVAAEAALGVVAAERDDAVAAAVVIGVVAVAEEVIVAPVALAPATLAVGEAGAGEWAVAAARKSSMRQTNCGQSRLTPTTLHTSA